MTEIPQGLSEVDFENITAPAFRAIMLKRLDNQYLYVRDQYNSLERHDLLLRIMEMQMKVADWATTD
jgi:hypothetical protein